MLRYGRESQNIKIATSKVKDFCSQERYSDVLSNKILKIKTIFVSWQICINNDIKAYRQSK